MGGVVIVCAFDPIEELDDRTGLMVLASEFAHRLIAESRAELVSEHVQQSMRYVNGSAANEAAREALRAKRGKGAPRRPRQVAKLES